MNLFCRAKGGSDKPGSDKPPERKEGQLISGTVKRWDVDKGFGFVACDDGGEDLFIHQSTIRVDGNRYRAIPPGARVICEYHVRDGKETAVSCTAEDGRTFNGFSSKLEATKHLGALASGVSYGTIKFMNNKGFGFIVPEAGGDDVFVHVQDVQSFEMLQQGAQVSYTISTKKGLRPQAVRVIPLCPPAPRYPVVPTIVYPADPFRLPLPLPPTEPSLLVGTIKWYNPERGFGFILSTTGGGDIYFNTADVVQNPPQLPPLPTLVQGDEVMFTKVLRRNGQAARAINVTRITQPRALSFPGPAAFFPPPNYWPSPYPPPRF